MTRARALSAVLATALVIGGCAAGAQATKSDAQIAQATADSVLEAKTRVVASELRCPVCQGLSIQDSPSELSQQMRALVKEQLAAGKTPDEVKAYFIARYGEWILLAPRARGFNLVAYALPAFIFLGGLGLITIVVRRWTAAGAAESAVSAPATGGDTRSPD